MYCIGCHGAKKKFVFDIFFMLLIVLFLIRGVDFAAVEPSNSVENWNYLVLSTGLMTEVYECIP